MTGSVLAFPTPASLGSLDHYIQAVNRFPLLTAEQETELGRRWRNAEDVDAARQIVLSHLRLVSFALHWIKAEIHEYVLRNWRLVKIATTKAQRKLFFNLRSMKRSSAALSTSEAEAIAADLGVKPEEVFEMETRLSGGDVALDPTPGDEESVTPIAYLSDSDDEPALILDRAQTAANRSAGLRSAMSKLDDRSRRIIEARWLREDDEAATLQQLADEYGVSAERIRQIESKALKTMRSQMVALQ